MNFPSSSLLSFSSFLSFALSDRPPCNHSFCDLQNSLFSWIESNGGYINPKVELSTGPDPNWRVRGVFTTSQLEVGEKIFSLTPNLQICDTNMCELVNKVRNELVKAEESFWWPYISAMEDHLVDIPSIWNEQERSILNDLAPNDWQRHLVWFEQVCGGDVRDAHHLRSMLLVVARSNGNDSQACMSPFYDSLNHANGNLVNTDNFWNGENFEKIANQVIGEGQQVFNSFGLSDVGRLFRDYGFISQYPRLWTFTGVDGQEYAFECFDENGLMIIDINPYDSPHQQHPESLANQLTLHLNELTNNPPVEFSEDDPNLDPWRHRIAREYRAEYLHAMTTALEACNSQIASMGEI